MNRLYTLCVLAWALGACGSRDEGSKLSLQLTRQPAQQVQAEETSRTFINRRGERIVLTRAYVTLSSVEIFPCPTAARWWRQLSLVGTAHAHSLSNSRRLGVPHVESLERADGAVRELGILQPPPGDYCRVRLAFGPADVDAEDLPEGGLMEGRTLLMEGLVTSTPQAQPRSFRLESAAFADVELPLEGQSLTEENPEARLLFTLVYDQWLDAVEWESAAAAEQVLSGVSGSVKVSRP
jgi:hypothetical protein